MQDLRASLFLAVGQAVLSSLAIWLTTDEMRGEQDYGQPRLNDEIEGQLRAFRNFSPIEATAEEVGATYHEEENLYMVDGPSDRAPALRNSKPTEVCTTVTGAIEEKKRCVRSTLPQSPTSTVEVRILRRREPQHPLYQMRARPSGGALQ